MPTQRKKTDNPTEDHASKRQTRAQCKQANTIDGSQKTQDKQNPESNSLDIHEESADHTSSNHAQQHTTDTKKSAPLTDQQPVQTDDIDTMITTINAQHKNETTSWTNLSFFQCTLTVGAIITGICAITAASYYITEQMQLAEHERNYGECPFEA